MLYKVVPALIFLDEILKCDRSNETDFWGAAYYAVQLAVLALESVEEILKCNRSNESH